MRICMLIDAWEPVWGGGQAHVWEVSSRLVKSHNCIVDIFVINLKNKKKHSQVESYLGGKLRIFRVGKPRDFSLLTRLIWCWNVFWKVKKINKGRKYDIIHAHSDVPGIPGKFLSRSLGIPVVYTVHGSGLKVIREMYKGRLRSFVVYHLKKFLETGIKYDTEISVDKEFLKYNNVNNNIEVIPNGVEIEKFDKIPAKKSKKFKILFVGRIHPQKGLRYLIKAVDNIRHRLKNAEIHIVGTGPRIWSQELEKEIEKLDLQKIVRLRGAIHGDNLIREYKSSHLFILPSVYEGQPLTLLEAWAAKLPVIVTDVGGNRDFVVDGKNGFIISPRDSVLLAKTILKALQNKNLEKIGEEGHKTSKKYSWKAVTGRIIEVYKKTLEKYKS